MGLMPCKTPKSIASSPSCIAEHTYRNMLSTTVWPLKIGAQVQPDTAHMPVCLHLERLPSGPLLCSMLFTEGNA